MKLSAKLPTWVFGWNGLPVYDLSRAYYTLGVGADFLGGWASPVYYARQFGEFRQGRRQIRGQLVQAESRLSVTAAAADRWLPLRPGTEPLFLAAVGRLLLDGRLARNAEALPKPVAQVFQEADPARLLATCGLDEKRVRQIAQELGESEAPLVLAGASIPQTNSVEAIVASHYVNLMLGNMGKPGGVLTPAGNAQPPGNRAIVQALSQARVVFIDGANPVYTMPRSVGVAEALARAELVVSFGTFSDDSSAWADILMPDHHELESAMALLPAVSAQPAVAVSTPFVEPLYDTRAVETTLAQLAAKIGAGYQAVTPKDIVEPMLSGDMTYDDVARQGGLWLDAPPATPARPITVSSSTLALARLLRKAIQPNIRIISSPTCLCNFKMAAARTSPGSKSCPTQPRAPFGACLLRSIPAPRQSYRSRTETWCGWSLPTARSKRRHMSTPVPYQELSAWR